MEIVHEIYIFIVYNEGENSSVRLKLTSPPIQKKRPPLNFPFTALRPDVSDASGRTADIAYQT